jgi:hypothetical protein
VLMAACVGQQDLGMYNNAADICYVSLIVAQMNKIMNGVQTYSREGMNNKAADIIEGELYCCTN